MDGHEFDTKPLNSEQLEEKYDVNKGLAEAAAKLGVDSQPLMVSQVGRFVAANESLMITVAMALRSRDEEEQAAAKKTFEYAAAANGLKIKSVPAIEADNPGRLVKNVQGEWELLLDPSLRTRPEEFLKEAMHEFGAYWLMKHYRMEKNELPGARTRHPNLVDKKSGRPKEFAVTHLIDATLLQLAGKLMTRA